MRTEIVKIYTFNELSEEAKDTAVENLRRSYYDYNDFAGWAVDNCSLFEPKHNELEELFGTEYKFPLIENTRKNIFFDTDRNYFLDCQEAMQVTNDTHFLKWLGINEELAEKTDYKIYTPNGRNSDTIIEFEEGYSCEFTDEDNKILMLAEDKFNQHIKDILERIKNGIDYRYTDEAITEDIEANEYEFTEDGNLY